MSYAILRELRDLPVVVVHPLDNEGKELTEHLRRIGCKPQLVWPVPQSLPKKIDMLIIAIRDEQRAETRAFLKQIPNPRPPIVAVVGYEDPSTLQLVLESGALAVISYPIKPFGLLTNLAIARNVWNQVDSNARDARRLKRKVLGEQVVVRAKTILMATKTITEDEAHRELREQAMAARLSIEQFAQRIVSEASLSSDKVATPPEAEGS
ncbi:ANTAR domain-containing response regulator [Agrobacterium sp. NPDC090273]|uniref:ANTAR domain-containing response regulator n=1 Tax=Agrobacterium sp. NPDC090273 TaxID=3363919 RepID=UPI00383B354F